jgi:hypothetical protein
MNPGQRKAIIITISPDAVGVSVKVDPGKRSPECRVETYGLVGRQLRTVIGKMHDEGILGANQQGEKQKDGEQYFHLSS